MKTTILLVLASLIGPSLFADTIRMRDGKEYEGVVISEEGDEYVVMVQVTETIRDQRRIAKKDVLEIVGERKDEAAYEEIKDLVPTPDRLDAEAYKERIAKVEDFFRKFPDSPLVPKVEPILMTLEDELTVVAAGGIKFEGEMLGAEERKAAAFSLDSQMVAATMEKAIAERRRIDALRAWDKLESEFPTSRAYRDAIPEILPVMRLQLAAVNRELDTFDRRLQERISNLERVPEKDRERAKQAIEREANEYLARIAKEKEEGIRWISLDPFQKEPLSRAKSLLESEIRQIEKIDTVTMPDGDAAWAEAWATLSGEPTKDEVRDALAKARNAQLPRKYLEILEAKAPKP